MLETNSFIFLPCDKTGASRGIPFKHGKNMHRACCCNHVKRSRNREVDDYNQQNGHIAQQSLFPCDLADALYMFKRALTDEVLHNH